MSKIDKLLELVEDVVRLSYYYDKIEDLFITINGAKYVYHNVPKSLYNDFVDIEKYKPGKALDLIKKHIKDYEKIDK